MTGVGDLTGEPATPGSVTRLLPTVADTLALGRAVGSRLRAGDLIILVGALGAGKTALTKGIGAGMGVAGLIMSPTFVVARVHRPAQAAAAPALVHVDAYRLNGSLELDDLDLDTELTTSAVVVEWGEGLAEQLAEAHLRVELERRPDDSRIARLVPVGGDWADRLADL